MNTISLSFQTPIKQTGKASETKTASAATSETVDFASLLNAVSSGTAETQTTTEDQKQELLGKLEQMLEGLEKLPQDNLTPEQQEMLQALMQLLTPQAPAESLAQGTSAVEGVSESPANAVASQPILNGKAVINPVPTETVASLTTETPTTELAASTPAAAAVIEEPAAKPLALSQPAIEKLASDPTAQEKLIGLLEEAIQELKKITEPAPPENKDAPKVPGNPKNLDEAFGKVTAFVQQLETEQQETEAKASVKQVQQLEQVLKQVTGLVQEPANLVQPTEIKPAEIQPAPLLAADLAKQAPSTSEPPVSAPQEPAQPMEAAEPTQSVPAPSADTAKASQAAARPEAPAPPAAVRMSNLVEELGEVMRGNFRLNGEGDTKQIKVSIFPEHLGHLDIRLTSTDGKMIAQIFTSSLAAKEALDMQANILRNSLLQQGIAVEKIEITQQSTGQSFGQQSANPDQRFSQQQKQGQNVRSRNGYQRMEEETAAIVRQQPNGGSVMKVDYTI
ncbi:flagellar hook-length control protein FliK [Planococcus sp. YIM B11945]|uniref:flagellar hook-length control protein FliK n=1 Tax=Planococcus sp. YIM B11945 TaxID=3435410 RepID=UPI003D7E0695